MTGEPAFEAGTFPPTQTRHPWRATVRTVFAGVVALVPVAVAVLTDLHLDGTVVGGTALAVLAAVTRVLAIPAVDDWVGFFAPWLAAQPRQEIR